MAFVGEMLSPETEVSADENVVPFQLLLQHSMHQLCWLEVMLDSSVALVSLGFVWWSTLALPFSLGLPVSKRLVGQAEYQAHWPCCRHFPSRRGLSVEVDWRRSVASSHLEVVPD